MMQETQETKEPTVNTTEAMVEELDKIGGEQNDKDKETTPLSAEIGEESKDDETTTAQIIAAVSEGEKTGKTKSVVIEPPDSEEEEEEEEQEEEEQEEEQGKMEIDVKRKKPGRPKGSKNKAAVGSKRKRAVRHVKKEVTLSNKKKKVAVKAVPKKKWKFNRFSMKERIVYRWDDGKLYEGEVRMEAEELKKDAVVVLWDTGQHGEVDDITKVFVSYS